MKKNIKYEPFFWFSLPIIILLVFFSVYGTSLIGSAIALDLMFCFSPMFFALLFKIVYGVYPISHFINTFFSKDKAK